MSDNGQIAESYLNRVVAVVVVFSCEPAMLLAMQYCFSSVNAVCACVSVCLLVQNH